MEDSNRNVFLIGYRGSGKTTVGRLLGERLSLSVIDTDVLVERAAGRTIAAIFAEEGEPAFRDLETIAIKNAVENAPAVISLGGGAILREENRELLKLSGIVFWLHAPAEVLWERIAADKQSADTRPALTHQTGLAEVHAVLSAREPLYRQTAHHIIDAEPPPDDIAYEIAQKLKTEN